MISNKLNKLFVKQKYHFVYLKYVHVNHFCTNADICYYQLFFIIGYINNVCTHLNNIFSNCLLNEFHDLMM